MSEMIIDKENGKGRINNVTFCYVKMQEGGWKYQSKTEKEYSVDCVVDKKTAKEYKKMFPKNSCKEIDTEDFEGKFKISPPYPDADEQFVIKLKADANLKADVPMAALRKGDSIPYEWNTRPKVFVPVKGGVKDTTMEVLVANGSKGSVSFKILENDFGTFSQLTGILVEDLIEYEQKDTASDFGKVVGGLRPGNGNPQQVADVGGNDMTPADVEPDSDPELNPDFDEPDIPF